MERKVLRPVTLSSGLTLPAGTSTFLSTGIHRSPDIYPNPDEFIPDRFLKMQESDNGANSKFHFVSTSPEHLGFGHGRNSCPGRFFAGNELKIAIVQILLAYDLKLPKDGRLPDVSMGQSEWVPSEQKILFRKRGVDLGIQF
jgi:cytochrome P450